MALYVSSGRRTRRIVIAAVLAAVIGLAVGWLIGRAQVPGIDARVRSVAEDGRTIATRIERLDIEYEQARAGAGDDVRNGVLVPLREQRRALQETMDRAPWLGTQTRADLLDAILAVESVARRGVPVDAFRERALAAGDEIRTTLAPR